MEQLTYDIMFRWFVGLSMDPSVWDVTVFTKNRDRLLEGDIARRFLAAILADPQVKSLLSDEHFSVDGTMIEAWASMKSFKPKDGSGEPLACDGGLDAQQVAFGGVKQFIARVRAFGGQIGITADPQAVAGEVGAGDAGHVTLVEQRQLQCPALQQVLDRRAAQGGDPLEPGGLTSSVRRAWVIMPRSPTSTT